MLMLGKAIGLRLSIFQFTALSLCSSDASMLLLEHSHSKLKAGCAKILLVKRHSFYIYYDWSLPKSGTRQKVLGTNICCILLSVIEILSLVTISFQQILL